MPLVAHDPYFSIWSNAHHPAAAWPVHWTGTNQALTGMARVDGAVYRLLGFPNGAAPAAELRATRVTPTSTRFEFAAGGVALSLEFLTPVLPQDPALLTRPVSYIVWHAAAADGAGHEVQVYFDHSAELCVHEPAQEVAWERCDAAGLRILRMGSAAQPALARVGDWTRADWGHVYLASADARAAAAIGSHERLRGAFLAGGRLPAEEVDARQPRAAGDDWPVSALAVDLGTVGAAGAPESTARALLAYDLQPAVEYLGRPLAPYWRTRYADLPAALAAAEAEFPRLQAACRAFDAELTADLERAGGADYAYIGTLAYRQALAGHGWAAAPDGRLFAFAKENTSNGCIGTVDVIYPAAPLFLLFHPDLLQANLDPVFEYAASARWRFPFAPHDLGTYPKANGQVYGGGERSEENQMPVEESGNLIILTAALCQARGDWSYAERWFPLLERWAEYLRSKGFDPENQLCTDDFTGHLAHNVNLSAKTIVALACFARLCERTGRAAPAAEYRRLAEEFVPRWAAAAGDAGGHFRLAFDRPGTWSQKYNLVWDRILGLDLFPPAMVRAELDGYAARQQAYGLPLDNRAAFTKSDWLVWTAALAPSREEFAGFLAPLARFLDETPDRVPFADWYQTDTGKARPMFARPVIGGVFVRLLADAEVWRKWAQRSRAAR